MDTSALIEQGVVEMGLSLPPGAAQRLSRFLALLRKWNRAQNLTAITEPRAMVAGHVLDSLSGLPWLSGGRVLDVGSGAGLPGVPLAIADPAREFVLLDSRRKRVQFLLYASSELGLDNVRVVEARIDKYRPDGNFGTLTARAFAPIPALLPLAMPFVNAGARLVVWQGSDSSEELAEALAGSPVCYAVHPVRVPGIRASRHIAVIGRLPQPPARVDRGAIGEL
jgi:16S rRNA (guanine527-N7)-methyltransferase